MADITPWVTAWVGILTILCGYVFKLITDRFQRTECEINSINICIEKLTELTIRLQANQENCQSATGENFRHGRERFSLIEADAKALMSKINDLEVQTRAANVNLEHIKGQLVKLEHKIDDMEKRA